MAYDWKIGLKKFAVSAGIIVTTGLIAVWQNDIKYMGLVPLVEVILNWLKHR